MKFAALLVLTLTAMGFAIPIENPEGGLDPAPKALGTARPDTSASDLDGSVVLKAMASEMKRSLDSLRVKGGPKPYFLSYLLWDIESYRMQASLGSCEQSGFDNQHLLEVDLRLGSYKQDNSNFQGGIIFGPRLRLPLPQENDTNLIRLSLWAYTDARYKVAVEQLAQKRAFLENQTGKDALPDFSRQKSLRQTDTEPRTPPDSSLIISMGKELSGYLAKYPWLAESRVGYQYYYTTFYYVDSEGARYIQTVKEHTLLVSLFTQAGDGAPLWDYLRISTRNPGTLSMTTLKAAVDSIAARLAFLRESKPLANYRGPVLFTATAAGELINKAFLVPQMHLREPLGAASEPNFLVSLAGRKYFPSGFDIQDSPSDSAYGNQVLAGHYRFDHQGQPAEAIDLVKDGRIQDFYHGKVPVFRAKNHHSNGHWRYGGGFPGVAKVSSSNPMEEKAMMGRLISLGLEEGIGHALVISKPLDEDAFKLLHHPLASQLISGEAGDGKGTFVLNTPCEVDLIDARTGKPRPVRGLGFPALDSKSLRDIVAVGSKPYLHEPQAAYSILCPWLLFSLLDLTGDKATQPHLPYLP